MFNLSKIKRISDTDQFLLRFGMCNKCGGEIRLIWVSFLEGQQITSLQCGNCKAIFML